MMKPIRRFYWYYQFPECVVGILCGIAASCYSLWSWQLLATPVFCAVFHIIWRRFVVAPPDTMKFSGFSSPETNGVWTRLK